MKKIWDIHGGVHPAENKAQSTQRAIGQVSLPEHIILPLNQHIGGEAIPIVAIGDYVLKGQRIAEAQGIVSAPVHASTSGTVTAIADFAVPHPSGLSARCIVISPDGRDQWTELNENPHYQSEDKNELLEKIRQSGIVGLGGAGFPSAVKLNPRADHHIDTLILNGTECEPYITADDMLMRERADDIIAGTELFARLLNEPANILIGIEDNKPEAIAAMRKAAQDTRVQIISFPTKYPSGGEKQLIQILTGKEVPSGGIPAQLGMVVQNVGTALAAYRAVRFGEPLISRVTTVVGEALQKQGNIEVLIGTPINHILAQHGFNESQCARVIIGGPMMGYAMQRTDIPLIKTTNCILVPSHSEMPEPEPAQPCIRCGMCAEVCPANLLPQQLLWFAQAEEIDKLKSHHLFDCIECGACSYVCPSNIPLVQYYRAAKGTIRQLESEKQKSDRSRLRFEKRQERIAKEEAEKEAKRAARKQAADELKKQLAEQPSKNEAAASIATNTHSTTNTTNITNTNTNTNEPTISDRKNLPETDASQANISRAKLERALSSAQSRAERAAQQLADEKQQAASDQRLEMLQARLKQAEQKVSEAQVKLDHLQTESTQHAAEVGGTAAVDSARINTEVIKEKLALSPLDTIDKNISTLQKRLAVAEEKYSEAEQGGLATAAALKQGVEKLRAKLGEAKAERQSLAAATDTISSSPTDQNTRNAADAAIAKAQAKADALQSMSASEKAQANIESLKTRLEKARQRLAEAEAENSEHIEAFKNSVEKLEQKLKHSEQAYQEYK